MKKTTTILASCSLLIACSDQYPSSEGKSKPYILKEGCKFSIVEERSMASVTSPDVKGADPSTVSMGVSLGEKSISVSNCELVENSHNLPIYED